MASLLLLSLRYAVIFIAICPHKPTETSNILMLQASFTKFQYDSSNAQTLASSQEIREHLSIFTQRHTPRCRPPHRLNLQLVHATPQPEAHASIFWFPPQRRSSSTLQQHAQSSEAAPALKFVTQHRPHSATAQLTRPNTPQKEPKPLDKLDGTEL